LAYIIKYVLARTLKYFESILYETFFIRIHKSQIVNILNGKGLDIQSNNRIIVFDGKKIRFLEEKLRLQLGNLRFTISGHSISNGHFQINIIGIIFFS
jgi:hypothetical protein